MHGKGAAQLLQSASGLQRRGGGRRGVRRGHPVERVRKGTTQLLQRARNASTLRTRASSSAQERTARSTPLVRVVHAAAAGNTERGEDIQLRECTRAPRRFPSECEYRATPA